MSGQERWGKRISPSKKCGLAEESKRIVNEDEERQDPYSQGAFEEDLEVLRIEVIQPRREFLGVVEGDERCLFIVRGIELFRALPKVPHLWSFCDESAIAVFL